MHTVLFTIYVFCYSCAMKWCSGMGSMSPTLQRSWREWRTTSSKPWGRKNTRNQFHGPCWMTRMRLGWRVSSLYQTWQLNSKNVIVVAMTLNMPKWLFIYFVITDAALLLLPSLFREDSNFIYCIEVCTYLHGTNFTHISLEAMLKPGFNSSYVDLVLLSLNVLKKAAFWFHSQNIKRFLESSLYKIALTQFQFFWCCLDVHDISWKLFLLCFGKDSFNYKSWYSDILLSHSGTSQPEPNHRFPRVPECPESREHQHPSGWKNHCQSKIVHPRINWMSVLCLFSF